MEDVGEANCLTSAATCHFRHRPATTHAVTATHAALNASPRHEAWVHAQQPRVVEVLETACMHSCAQAPAGMCGSAQPQLNANLPVDPAR